MPPSKPTSDSDEEGGTDWQKRVSRLQRSATLDTLETLGFDVTDIQEMQADALFLRKLRKASDTANAKVVTTLVGLLLTALGGLIVLGLQNVGVLGSK